MLPKFPLSLITQCVNIIMCNPIWIIVKFFARKILLLKLIVCIEYRFYMILLFVLFSTIQERFFLFPCLLNCLFFQNPRLEANRLPQDVLASKSILPDFWHPHRNKKMICTTDKTILRCLIEIVCNIFRSSNEFPSVLFIIINRTGVPSISAPCSLSQSIFP